MYMKTSFQLTPALQVRMHYQRQIAFVRDCSVQLGLYSLRAVGLGIARENQ